MKERLRKTELMKEVVEEIGEPLYPYLKKLIFTEKNSFKESIEDLSASDTEIAKWAIELFHDRQEESLDVLNSLWEDRENWIKFGRENDFEKERASDIDLDNFDTKSAWFYYGVENEWFESFDFEREPRPEGFWKDLSRIKKILRPIAEIYIQNKAKLPTYANLRDIGCGGALNGLKRYHNLSLLDLWGHMDLNREEFRTERPRGYWKDLENIKEEFEPVVEEHLEEEGRLPTANELEKEGLSGALTGLRKHHGLKLSDFWRKLGFDLEEVWGKKPNSYWNDFENIRKEIKQIAEYFLEEKDRLPTFTELEEEKGMSGALNSLYNRHDMNISKLWVELGYGEDKIFKKPQGYWEDLNNIKKEMKIVADRYVEDKGRLPRFQELCEEGLGGALQALRSHHDLYRDQLWREMGYDQELNDSTRDQYWSELDRIKEEIKPVAEEFLEEKGRLPTFRELEEKGMSGALDSLHRAHNTSLIEFWKEIGFEEEVQKKTHFYWSKKENIFKEIKPVAEKYLKKEGKLPTAQDLRDKGLGGALQGIYKNHDMGLNELWSELGFDLSNSSVKYPEGYWKDLENIKREIGGKAEKYLQEKGRLPYNDDLKEEGLSGALHGLWKYHDMNLTDLWEKLNYRPLKDKDGFKRFVENEEEARYVLEFFGGDERDVADVLSVMYPGLFSAEDLMEMFSSDGLSEWLAPVNEDFDSIGELVEAGSKLLPYDKEGFVADLVYKKAKDYVRDELGPEPPKEKRVETLEKLGSLMDYE